MAWITNSGIIYEGDCQFGDREATESELKPVRLQRELSEAASVYLEDMKQLNDAWLSASVADGTPEVVKKQAIVTSVTARKQQYAVDKAAIKAKYT